MLKMKTSLLILPLFLTISSCVSYYSVPEGYTGPTATIQDTATKTGVIKAESFQVSKINGQFDNNSPMATSYGGGVGVTLKESKRTVPANTPLTLSLYGGNIYAADGAALADRLTGQAKKSVSGDVTFTPKKDRVYKVNGVAGKETSSIWIEESSGKKVTDVITKS